VPALSAVIGADARAKFVERAKSVRQVHTRNSSERNRRRRAFKASRRGSPWYAAVEEYLDTLRAQGLPATVKAIEPFDPVLLILPVASGVARQPGLPLIRTMDAGTGGSEKKRCALLELVRDASSHIVMPFPASVGRAAATTDWVERHSKSHILFYVYYLQRVLFAQ
jgi:hypothetical protein